MRRTTFVLLTAFALDSTQLARTALAAPTARTAAPAAEVGLGRRPTPVPAPPPAPPAARIAASARASTVAETFAAPGSEPVASAVNANSVTFQHTYPAGWSLAAVPLVPDDPAPAAVFDEVPAPLRLYDYVDGQVTAPGEPGARNLAPGRAYWLLLAHPTTVRVTGNPLAPSAAHRVAIRPGWNAIATPWLAAGEWTDAQVSVRNGSATLALDEAVAATWIDGTLDDPNADGAYATILPNSTPAGQLLPWRGYELFSRITGELIFAPPPPDTVPPTVGLVGLPDGTTVTAPIEIAGSVGDANLVEWRLEYVSADGGVPVVIAVGDTPVTGGVLGTFDPTTLLNGIYQIQLVAVDAAGTTTTSTRSVVVSGDLKVGNFTVSFVDLEVPLAGLPIKVTRTYDSRDKRRGDFGIGWRVEIANLRISRNGPAGQGWDGTRSGGILPNYCIQPARTHLVTVTFPDGETHEFDAVPAPQCQQIIPLLETTVTYRARPGTDSTLAPLDGGTVLVASSGWPGPLDLLDWSTLEVYDPQAFQLTMPDGRSFVIHRQLGLQTIVDANGNQLQVGPNGIVHSSGKGVSFSRDGLGRITALTDPNGEVIQYAYDANGDLESVTDREGKVTRHTYDARHGLLSIDDPRGAQALRTEYDESGRLVRVIDALGHAIEYEHDVAGRLEVVRDRLGRATVLEYDDRGNVIRTTHPDGSVVQRTYDARSNKLTETDALGKTTTWVYDARDNVVSMTDPLGQTTSSTYNTRGQELTHTDGRGGVLTNVYDARGNRISTTDALARTTTYGYDARGNLTTITDPLGCVTRYEYDAAGNMTREIDPLGQATTYTFDANGRRLTSKRTKTRDGALEELLTTFVYDGQGREMQRTNPDGSIVRTEYDDAGRVIATVDPLDRRTTYTYDDAARLTETEFPDGTTELASYDAEGRQVSSTDRAGRVTTYEYDALGRLVRVVHPAGAGIVTSAYDAAGRLSSVTDARGSVTRYEYDAAGRRLKTIDPAGRQTVYTYDANGNPVSVRDPNGHLTTSEYDLLNRRTRVVLPDGTDRKSSYDAAGRLASETDPAGRTTQFTHDCAGRLLKVTDALGQITTFAYDEVGNRVSQTDAGGRTTTFSFDKLSREVRRVVPTGPSEERSYDAIGNLNTRVLFGGATVTYTYDAADRLTRRSYPDGTAVAFTYTATGQRATAVDARGTTRYQYDARDRLLRIEQPGAGLLEYEYDGQGNRTRLRASSGGTTFETTYTYDVAGRLATIRDPQGRTYSFGYDPNGNRTALSYPNGTSTTYVYDSLNRLRDLSAARGGSPLQSHAYTLGPAGNRIRVDELDGTARSYAYDAVYRLTQETVAGSTPYVKTFAYDPAGNRLTQTDTRSGALAYTYDARDQILAEGAATYAWDDDGNLRMKTGPDAAAYTWDLDQRLTRVAGADGTIVTHAYDADGNRVRTEITPATGPPTVTQYLVDTSAPASQVVLETDASGSPRAFYLRADDLLAVLRPASGTRFYHADGLGSIRALTDESGAVTDQYSFTAFGELLAHSGSDPNPYQFAGEALDANSGFAYHRARWMDPRVGRFISADPLDGVPHDPAALHRYLYAQNDPVNRVDPTGLFGDFSLGGLGMAMAIGATINSIASINAESTFQSIALAALEGAVQGAAFYVVGALAARLAWRIATARNVLQVGRFPLVGRGSPIAPYNVLQEVTAGHRGAIQAHHLLEARHLRAWGYSAGEIAAAPAQVLSQAEHAAISRELARLLPTGARYTREFVWRQYQIAYRNHPEYLDAILRYFL